MRQLQALLKAILLRRTKTSTIDGKPILTLPPKTTTEARAVFSEDERNFYKALEGKAQLQFNKYMKAGTVGRNYSNVLVLLLRLRQACCHPHLIKDFAIHTGTTMTGVDLLENARTLPKDVVERIKENEDGAFECPVCLDAAENPVIFNPCGHTLCNECLARLVDDVSQQGGGEPICPHCRAKINTAKVTDHGSFLKVFCPERLSEEEVKEEDAEATASDDSGDSSDNELDSDDDDGEDLKDFIVGDDEIEYDDGNDEEDEDEETAFEKSIIGKSAATGKTKTKAKTPKKSKTSKKGKGKENAVDNHKSLAQLRREGLKNKAAKKKYLKRLKKDFQTSAKIDRTLELLESIHARGTGEKTIVFSGFTSFLDLLEVPLHRHTDLSIYARYDGSMPPKSRNDAVLEFTSSAHCKIMLVSLKAGNAGLNLTAASQVIILDPHWNPFVEMQAADRAYRIGQMRPVEVHRVLIDGEGMDVGENGTATVEDRILALQEKKRELVENALDENAGNSVARLGVRELGYLFVSFLIPCIVIILTVYRVSTP
jgi:SNF2 family DNA or RNA helicase